MKKSKILALLIAIIMIASVFTGCGNKNEVSKDEQDEVKEEEKEDVEEKASEEYGVKIEDDKVTFTDDRDKEVALNKNPEKVVCLYNSYLDIWYKCGGTVIGRVEESDDKPVDEARDAEVVGEMGSPSLEKILSLEPDLVILNNKFKEQAKMADVLEQNNIEVIALENKGKEDYFKTVRLFTALTEREDLYEEYGAKVKESIDEIVEKAPKDKEYKVLILFASAKGIKVKGSDSMVGEMLADLNTINISDTDGQSEDSKEFSMEKIIEEDPDFIFVQTMGSDKEKVMDRLKKDVESNPAWASLKAVKDDKYIILPKDLYLFKPNERYAEAYEGLAKILYPEVFN